MSERSWLRRNLFLVAGVSLPLVVVAFYLVASWLPRWFIEPPRYGFLFTATRVYPPHESELRLDYDVRDRRLVARLRPRVKDGRPDVPKLFHFDHRTLETTEVEVEIPEGLAAGDSFPVEAFAGYRLLTEPRAPDGYTAVHKDYGSRGLFGELFGMSRRRNVYVIRKGGRVVSVHPPLDADWRYYSYYQGEFLGWMSDE